MNETILLVIHNVFVLHAILGAVLLNIPKTKKYLENHRLSLSGSLVAIPTIIGIPLGLLIQIYFAWHLWNWFSVLFGINILTSLYVYKKDYVMPRNWKEWLIEIPHAGVILGLAYYLGVNLQWWKAFLP